MSSGGLSTITCKQQHLRCSVSSTANLAISPAPVKEDIFNNAFKGRVASVQRIAKCGHLVPLVQPDAVADAILSTFSSMATHPVAKSRL